jgi:glycosyltransferase involved in cell wall biosynthesis
VLNQTYPNIEYILVDGKSTDNTMSIIKDFESKFAAKGISYRYVSEPDKGIYDAMNKGIAMANGDWVGIINSDDWYELDACAKVMEHINLDTRIAYGICAMHEWVHNEYHFSGVMQHSPESMYYCNYDMAHPAVFINSQIYKKHQFDLSYKLAADVDFLMRIFEAGYRSTFIPFILTNFRCDGATGQQKFLSGKENLEIRFKYRRISLLHYLKRKIIYYIKFAIRY